MKQKKILIGLIAAILIVFVVDGAMILFVNKQKNTPTVIEPTTEENTPTDINSTVEENTEAELGIKKRIYTCIGQDKDITNPNLNISLHYKTQYSFSISDDDKIISGSIQQILTFNTKEDYNLYIQNDTAEINATREEDAENNMLTYTLNSIFPNTKNEEQLQFTEDYLKVVEEQGFICEE